MPPSGRLTLSTQRPWCRRSRPHCWTTPRQTASPSRQRTRCLPTSATGSFAPYSQVRALVQQLTAPSGAACVRHTQQCPSPCYGRPVLSTTPFVPSGRQQCPWPQHMMGGCPRTPTITPHPIAAADPVCGDGRCEAPWEFPAWGPFGCSADCGAQPNTTRAVVVATADFAGHPSLSAATLQASASWNLCLEDGARRKRGEPDLCWCGSVVRGVVGLRACC